VKQMLLAGLGVVLLAMGVMAQEEPLSQEEQIRIITSYMYIRGQLDQMPPHMASADPHHHEHDHDHDHDHESVIIKCGTPIVLAFELNKHRLDKELLLQLGARLYARPTDRVDAYRDSDSGWFRIHYATSGPDTVYRASVDTDGNGHPDYVDTVAMVMDSVRMFFVDSLGYPVPPSDDFYPSGGSEHYDVYLYNIGPGFYGLAYPDSVRIDGSLRGTSFLELSNDYQQLPGYVQRPLDAVRVTAAHEYFHAIQFGMDVTEFEYYPSQTDAPEKRYWMEMSAVWAEEVMYDDINDYYNYLPAYFNDPRISIQQQKSYVADVHPYASAVFPIYMTEKYDLDVVRQIWQQCMQRGAGPHFMESCDSVLKVYSGRTDTLVLVDHFREFALWNYFTGERRHLAPHDSIGYSEGEFYPEIPNGAMLTIADTPATLNFSPEHWATSYARRDNVWAMIWDSTWFVCYDTDCDSAVELVDGLEPGLDTVLVVDSVFTIALSFSRFYEHPWGVNVIYYMRNRDSTEVDAFVLPANYDGQQVYFLVTPDPRRYQRIVLSVSPASTDRRKYDPRRINNGVSVFYATYDYFDTTLIPSDVIDPAAGYAAQVVPYPNPFVVSDVGSDPLRISVRLESGRDPEQIISAADAYLEVDIFTTAGEWIWGYRATTSGEVRGSEAEYSLEWPLVNQTGTQVASGVYVVLCRLYQDQSRANELVNQTGKVVIVR